MGGGAAGVLIRAAAAADVARIRAIVNAAYRGWIAVIGKPPGPMLDDYEALVAQGCAWVTEDAGALRGVLVLMQHDDHLLLDNVAVAPEAQGKGVGRALVAFAEDRARAMPHRTLRLYTHARMESNIALYRRLGFAETHRAEQDGYDRVFMAKHV
jgi:ribosomal protein S18 acetylase RimI-like enzyme